ncbi:MAG: ATP-binding cassette domain-containing protein [Actinobacteria bacterium]|jgi:energy-coupling factor transport system ATP-binding protein|nr:MAG: ATP-binding cassette domain-containing protein [Actinomycetota bacterium]
MGIALKGVGFTYLPGTPIARDVLSSIDLHLHAGEILCLMGRTGSGKSTLLNVMSGLLGATCGEISLDGENINDRAGTRALRNAAGVLLQSSEMQLFAESVEKDVAFGPRNLGQSGEELKQVVRDSLAAVGLDPEVYSSRSPFTLSEGEMRRVALAGVLAMRPRYLLMDEPTSGLDLPGRRLLYAILEGLRENGVGVLMVTHDWEEVELLANRVAVLSQGHILLEGEKEVVATATCELASAGLRPPALVAVLFELRRMGLDLPIRLSSPVETAAIIAAALEGAVR